MNEILNLCESCIHKEVCYSVAECLNYLEDFKCNHYMPETIPEDFKPLIDKVVEILPDLTDAIIEQLPQIISLKIKCSECSYYKDTWGAKMDGGVDNDK